MATTRVLVIEDDVKTAATLRLYLENAGYRVDVAADGLQGLELARSLLPDVVILDLMLPGMDGRQLCRKLRTESAVPVLMLTARSTEEDRIAGLELGADDYIAKPFSPREVVARVRAVLRRTDPATDPRPLRFGALCIDPARQEVTIGDAPVPLTRTEFQILHALALAPGRVLSRAQLVERAFGPHYEGTDRTVDAHVKNLRRKIEPQRDRPTYVVTVFGVGYRFDGRPDVP